jgi:hypothetical protein
MCCNARTPPLLVKSQKTGRAVEWNSAKNGTGICTKGATGHWSCPGIGQCCDRSTLADPHKTLIHDCSLCNVYNPCDRASCAARPDKIRNAQHYPFIFGTLLALLTNGYILYSYLVQEDLRKVTITALLAWASIAELLFCLCALTQELSFRYPNEPCIPGNDSNEDGLLDAQDCAASGWHGWPNWQHVDVALNPIIHGKKMPSVGFPLRGQTINGCWPMSVMFQLTWTASGSFIFMISVDLLLNLFTSPFGNTKRRWMFYQCWTWMLSIGLSTWLALGGEWGVSFDSILEDFCWNINFQRHGSLHGLSVSKVVYGLMILYPLLSLVVVMITHFKMKGLVSQRVPLYSPLPVVHSAYMYNVAYMQACVYVTGTACG